MTLQIDRVEGDIYHIKLSRDEFVLLANTLNEVINGIKNIDIEKDLLVSEDKAESIHKSFLQKYDDGIEDSVVFNIKFGDFFVLQRSILAVMRDFNEYNEYHVRLGVEFDEYLNLLSGINSIVEKICRI